MPATAHYRGGPVGIVEPELAAWVVSNTNVTQVFAARGRDIDRGIAEQVVALLKLASVATSVNASTAGVSAQSAEEFSVVGDRPLSASTAASLIGVTAEAMRLAAREKRIPAGRAGRQWLFNRSDVLDYGRRRAA